MKNLTIIIALLAIVSFPAMAFAQSPDKLEKTYKKIFTTKEENLSKKELQMKYKFGDFFMNNLKVENGKLVSSLTKDDFEKAGFPLYLYDEFNANLKTTNDMIQKEGLDPQHIYDGMVRQNKDDQERISKIINGK